MIITKRYGEVDLTKLYSTDDAAVWAREFMKSVDSGAFIDEGFMIGWFANAMVTAAKFACEDDNDPT